LFIAQWPDGGQRPGCDLARRPRNANLPARLRPRLGQQDLAFLRRRALSGGLPSKADAATGDLNFRIISDAVLAAESARRARKMRPFARIRAPAAILASPSPPKAPRFELARGAALRYGTKTIRRWNTVFLQAAILPSGGDETGARLWPEPATRRN
jgi:hypothetical protein